MWEGLSCFLSSRDGYVGELLELQQGREGPLEVPDVRCDKPRDASLEMGLISPGGENLLEFLELRQVLSTYDGVSGKASPQASCSGASRDSSPVDAGA